MLEPDLFARFLEIRGWKIIDKEADIERYYIAPKEDDVKDRAHCKVQLFIVSDMESSFIDSIIFKHLKEEKRIIFLYEKTKTQTLRKVDQSFKSYEVIELNKIRRVLRPHIYAPKKYEVETDLGKIKKKHLSVMLASDVVSIVYGFKIGTPVRITRRDGQIWHRIIGAG